jgi:hypothetical protein
MKRGRFWRSLGLLGLGSSNSFARTSCRDSGPTSLLDLGEAPLIETLVGIAGVQEGEFRVILFLLTDTIWMKKVSQLA